MKPHKIWKRKEIDADNHTRMGPYQTASLEAAWSGFIGLELTVTVVCITIVRTLYLTVSYFVSMRQWGKKFYVHFVTDTTSFLVYFQNKTGGYGYVKQNFFI